MSIRRRLLFLPPLVLGAAVLAMVVLSQDGPTRAPAQEKAARVQVLTLEAMPFVPRVVGYGTVAPGRSWDAVAQVAGRVATVSPRLDRGEMIEAGTVIIEIADEDYQLAVAQADAEISSAQAAIDELDLEVANLQVSLELEKQALTLAESDLERQRRLANRGTAAQAVVEQRELETIRQRATIQDLENRLKLMPTQRRTLELTKAVHEATLAVALLDLERTKIRAPFTGRVAAAEIEATQYVGVGQVLATIDGVDTAEINVQIPPARMRPFAKLAFGSLERPASAPIEFRSLATRANIDAVVRLQLDDRDIEWPGRVVRASETVDQATRTIGLIVAVDAPYSLIRPGERPPLLKDMFVEVELRADPVDSALVLPRSAVHDGAVHLVDAESRLTRRPVDGVRAFGDLVVIESGLVPGDTVILDDLSPAIDGMLLVPVPDDETAVLLRRRAAAEAP